MQKEEVVKIVADYVADCQIEMYSKIAALVTSIEDQNALRQLMNEKLDKIDQQSQDNHQAFQDHDGDEMEKYDQVIASINDLTTTMKALMEETAGNSRYVQSETYNHKFQKAVADGIAAEKLKEADIQAQIDAQKIPWKTYFNKAILTTISFSIIGLLGMLWLGFTETITKGP